jgi:hypothetical protein
VRINPAAIADFFTAPKSSNLGRQNVGQELTAKTSYMTGFDEWMCMPAIGTALAPPGTAADCADKRQQGATYACRCHASPQEGRLFGRL